MVRAGKHRANRKIAKKIDDLKEWKGRHQDGDKGIHYLETIINDLQLLVDSEPTVKNIDNHGC